MHRHVNLHRHVNRFGLAILITLGVIAWNQQRGHSYSPASSASPDASSFLIMTQAVTGVQTTADHQSPNGRVKSEIHR